MSVAVRRLACLALLLAAAALPSRASTLRLVNAANPGFNPGVLDDTRAIGDTFYLELRVNCTDTNVNGVEATIQYDGTQLQLLESATAEDTFFGATGINSDEDKTIFGDVLGNTGVFTAGATDTANYAAMTSADSASVDTRVCRFLFQVRTTATPGPTAITFKMTATETTAVTAADSNATNVLGATDTGLIMITAAPDTHIVLTLVSPMNSTSEFFSIYNPTSAAVDLSTYYVADDSAYYQIVNNPAPVGATDFVARFPTGTSLASGETITVAVSSAAFHAVFPGVKIDFELTQDGAVDGVADMADSDIGSTAGLTDGGEVLVLFQWDGLSDLVKDVDILRWGTGIVPNKSGVSIDGPDGGAGTSTYQTDSAGMSARAAPPAGQVLRRVNNWTIGDSGTSESKSGGNGITGHDETSEDVGTSWGASPDSAPWHEMVVAYAAGNYPTALAEAGETQVEALFLAIRGARRSADTLTQLDVRTIGSADTANIDTVTLWIDANADSVVSAGDTLVANLSVTGAKSWRFTGALGLPSGAGVKLILGFKVGDTVQNGETVLMRIDTFAVLVSLSDSGSFDSITNANAITLIAGILKVTKLAEAPTATIRPGDTGVTVLSVRITGAATGDSLNSVALANLGLLSETDVDVFLWRDADGSFTYSAGDTLVGQLAFDFIDNRWELAGLAETLAAGGETFVFTISVADTAAVEGDTFQASFPANSADAGTADTGPALAVTNANQQTLANPVGIAVNVVIAAAYVDDMGGDGDGEWVLLYNPTDTPANIQNWLIRNDAGVQVRFVDTTIPARGFYLVADNGFVKDLASWPNADTTAAGLGLTNSGANAGISLVDSTGATLDRLGWDVGVAPDVEGNQATIGAGQIAVRKANSLTAKIDVLLGGRDEFGGAAYDSYDNATDFLILAQADSPLWTLRTRSTPVETAGRKTTVVKIWDTVPSAFRNQSETGVTIAAFYIQGDTTAAGAINVFRVEATDVLADTNFDRVDLYLDRNGNARWDAGDSYVAILLPVAGTDAWETSGISYAFNSLAGETFLVVLDIADTVTDGETFQPRVILRSVKASGADSGSSIVRTNAGIVTLAAVTPLVIQKNSNVTSETIAPTADTKTVVAFFLRGDPTGDTLIRFTIENAGTLTTADISAVRLFRDANGDSAYSVGDTFVSNLVATAANRWEDTTLALFLGTGLNFVVTIDLGTATSGETFQARIPANGSNVALYDTGPQATVVEPGVLTVSNAMGIRILLVEVGTQSAPDFVELLVLDDGNGGAGADIAGWRISEYFTTSTADTKILGDTNNDRVIDTTAIVRTGDRIVIYDAAGTDSTVSIGGIFEAYNAGLAFTGTDDEVILYDSTGTARDAVAWADRGGSHTDAADLAALIAAGWWKSTSAVENGCVTPRSGSSFAGGYSIQRGGDTDRDTYLDWGEASVTPRAANSMESPPVAPARLAAPGLIDVPNDQGGALRISWTPDTSYADFLQYRIYLETSGLDNLLDSNIVPRTTIADSSLGLVDISGLVNGESYYAVVTVADSFGLEYRFGLTDTGPVAPANNITETPVLLVNEVNFMGTGATDTDYIEIYVANDGNPTGNLTISNWKIEWHSAGSKTLGAVTVTTGDYLLLNFNSAQANEPDSGGDGIVNLYDAGTGLVSTNGYVRVLNTTGQMVDFVFYANPTGGSAGATLTAVRQAIDSGGWTGDSVEFSAVNPDQIGAFAAGDILARDGSSSDTSGGRNDWSIAGSRSKGAANAGVENPITVPDSRVVRVFQDLPNDFGGVLQVGWDTIVSLADFVRYNLYVESAPIGTRIDTLASSALRPRATVADSSVGTATVSGLVDGESYWVVVTVTDTWGHERRTGLVETGPKVPVKNVTGTPVFRFTEVRFAGTDTEFIEIRVIDDGNPTGNLDIAGFKVTKDDTVTPDILAFASTTVADSDFIVLWNRAGTTESDSGGDGVVNIYNLTFSLAEGDENLFLIQGGGDTILDFVAWSTRDGAMTVSEVDDINYAIARGAWAPLGATQNNARDPIYLANFYDSSSITRDRNFTDSNSDTDWAVDSALTPGALPSMTESPFAAPAAVTGTDAADVPNDLGGAIRVVWNPVAVSDLDHYNVYRDTNPIPVSLYGVDTGPVTSAPVTDTSTTFTNLPNGVTYYFAVTAVDSYGNERKTALLVDSAAAVANVTGETLLITEVSFKEISTGVLGHDWIEIRVVDDGNTTGLLNLTSWKIVTTGSSDPAPKTIAGASVSSGELILVHLSAGTDEADSMAGNADGVLDLYFGAGTGLTGTDNSVALYRPGGDTEDFVAWASPAGAPVNAADSDAIAAAIAAAHWADNAPVGGGVGTEDGVNSDSVASNVSIVRSPDTADANASADWSFDTTPTPGLRNDTGTLWRIQGNLDLLGRAVNAIPITASNGTDTYTTSSDNGGTYVFRLPNGTYYLIGDTTHYLRRVLTGISVANASAVGQDIGSMFPGDANDDNRINIFDASMTKYAVDHATGNAAADHVDPVGTLDNADIQAVRDNFGRMGD